MASEVDKLIVCNTLPLSAAAKACPKIVQLSVAPMLVRLIASLRVSSLLFSFASHIIASHRIASHRIASHRIALHRTALHRISNRSIA
jgi:hypothetical protein